MAPVMTTMSVRTNTTCVATNARPTRVAARIQSVQKSPKTEFVVSEVAQKVTAAVLAGMLVATPVLAFDKRGICAGNPTAKVCLKDSGKKQTS
eukprot:g3693.t1